jgi:hypothetical protein
MMDSMPSPQPDHEGDATSSIPNTLNNIRITSIPLKGRGLLANKKFSRGECIMAEKPLLTFKESSKYTSTQRTQILRSTVADMGIWEWRALCEMFNAYSEEKIEVDEIDRGSLEIREMVLMKGILTTNG